MANPAGSSFQTRRVTYGADLEAARMDEDLHSLCTSGKFSPSYVSNILKWSVTAKPVYSLASGRPAPAEFYFDERCRKKNERTKTEARFVCRRVRK
jgi:hypothetical protein